MNDYQMIKLAADRGHDFRREADQARLARSVRPRKASTSRTHDPAAAVPRSTIRLTLDYLRGRNVA